MSTLSINKYFLDPHQRKLLILHSLPNTPDTEDPFRRGEPEKQPQKCNAVITLASVGGESYI